MPTKHCVCFFDGFSKEASFSYRPLMYIINQTTQLRQCRREDSISARAYFAPTTHLDTDTDTFWMSENGCRRCTLYSCGSMHDCTATATATATRRSGGKSSPRCTNTSAAFSNPAGKKFTRMRALYLSQQVMAA